MATAKMHRFRPRLVATGIGIVEKTEIPLEFLHAQHGVVELAQADVTLVQQAGDFC